jgi:tripartite-type tricarboxylate transporter receptor subunit TctC
MRIGLSMLAWLAALATPAFCQQTPEEFYKGKQMTLLVGSTPGGGYDTLARAVARHWPRSLPGAPNMIVQNMPGASSLTMASHVFHVAARDGSVIGLGNNAMPTGPILYPTAARFDAAKLSWIGGPSRDAQVVAVWHNAPAQTIDELFTKELIVGGDAVGSAPVDYPVAANVLLKTKFKVISGYKGTDAIDLAMERGEVFGNAGLGWVSAKVRNADKIASGQIKIIAQYGFRPHPDLPNVPLFKMPDNELDRQVLEILYARDETGRPFFGPPGIPSDRLRTLRSSFEAMLKDPQFLADASKLNLSINPVTAAELEQLTQSLSRISPEAAERARKILN